MRLRAERPSDHALPGSAGDDKMRGPRPLEVRLLKRNAMAAKRACRRGRGRASPGGRPGIRRLTCALAAPGGQGAAGGAERLPLQESLSGRGREGWGLR